jgi:hypothetical protein
VLGLASVERRRGPNAAFSGSSADVGSLPTPQSLACAAFFVIATVCSTRRPFEHNGSVATLEDWLDPQRLRDDYVPTGFRGYGITTRAVKGHRFGLSLSKSDKDRS